MIAEISKKNTIPTLEENLLHKPDGIPFRGAVEI
jgi:hypothetical protein